MHITSLPRQLQTASRLGAPRPAASQPQIPQESFTRSNSGEKIKQAAVLGGIGLIGAGLGAYAGMGTGIFAGLAGIVAGASGGAVAAAYLPGEKIKLGAIAGAIGGGLLGASLGHPALAAVMGLAGATLPVGGFMAIFAGAE
ncbi:MAG: hypothetical protein KC910_22215 [Candidatus Eremiobacteraeota bacterium]|nr:hypothetical protein [Candidatus Eremiobacteraeota bacterium]